MLHTDAPEGLCPQCLLLGMIGSVHDAAKAAPAEATPAEAPAEATAPAEAPAAEAAPAESAEA